ncbi:MAG: hypothetical protein IPO94_06765 [Saprospiraceae bacterium]|nr:hypothetical protein [Saprospiraceae bacterium]
MQLSVINVVLNSEGTDKCSNCGFSFANHKMNTVGKYLGDMAPKPTIVEKVISGILPADSNHSRTCFI